MAVDVLPTVPFDPHIATHGLNHLLWYIEVYWIKQLC